MIIVTAPAAASPNFLLRNVKALPPLCTTPEDEAALKALCADLQKMRPKDKSFHDSLSKAAASLGKGD